MTKAAKNNKITNEVKNEAIAQKEKRTLCYLVSKADHIIEIKQGNQTTFIQPFGRIKVTKELVKLADSNDAKYLAFIKI